MYEKYLKCIFLLTICIGCRANTVSIHASIFRPPQLPPHVKEAYERTAEALTGKLRTVPETHHHQHYYLEKPLVTSSLSTNAVLTNRKDTVYKPRVGEILVKDSALYNSETPASSQQQQHRIPMTMTPIRRNYWPLVDNTVTSLASKAAAGAAAVKNLLKVGLFSTFDTVNAAVEHKKHKIASYLIQAAQDHKIQQAREQEMYRQQMKLAAATLASGAGPAAAAAAAVGGAVGAVGAAVSGGVGGLAPTLPLLNQALHQHPLAPIARPLQALLPLKQKLAQNVVQHFAKKFKKPINPLNAPPWIVYSKTKTMPTTTISEGYIHTFDPKLMPQSFEGPREKNPYADMGVTSYKHFEDTILKELEEKEERKVEATMHTLLDDDYLVHDSLEGTKPGSSQEWQPFNANDNGLYVSPAKPFTVSSFTQSTFDRPSAFSDVRPVCEHLDEVAVQPTLFVYPAGAESQTNELQESTNEHSVTVKLTNSTTVNNTTTEKPNYPAYFIKQQQELRKLQQKLVGANRGKAVYGSKTTKLASTQQKQQQTQQQQQQPSQRGRQSPYGRRASTTTAGSITTAATSPTTLATPTTTTTEVPTYYYSINGTDDGFRPMLPSQIKAMKIKKPVHIKLNETTATKAVSPTKRPRNSILAQASHPHVSVVSAPDAFTKRGRNDINKSSYTRKAPKKMSKLTSTASTATGNATASSSTSTAHLKRNRGTIKFSDSLRQSQSS